MHEGESGCLGNLYFARNVGRFCRPIQYAFHRYQFYLSPSKPAPMTFTHPPDKCIIYHEQLLIRASSSDRSAARHTDSPHCCHPSASPLLERYQQVSHYRISCSVLAPLPSANTRPSSWPLYSILAEHIQHASIHEQPCHTL